MLVHLGGSLAVQLIGVLEVQGHEDVRSEVYHVLLPAPPRLPDQVAQVVQRARQYVACCDVITVLRIFDCLIIFIMVLRICDCLIMFKMVIPFFVSVQEKRELFLQTVN